MECNIFNVGDIYKNAKDELCEIVLCAEHTESTEMMIVYKMNDTCYVMPELAFRSQFQLTSAQEEIMENQSLLLEFLDLSSAEHKIRFLQKHKSQIDNKFLDLVGQCLDFVGYEEEFEQHFHGIIHYLQTIARYEHRA